jgi:hypothetical protein
MSSQREASQRALVEHLRKLGVTGRLQAAAAARVPSGKI